MASSKIARPSSCLPMATIAAARNPSAPPLKLPSARTPPSTRSTTRANHPAIPVMAAGDMAAWAAASRVDAAAFPAASQVVAVADRVARAEVASPRVDGKKNPGAHRRRNRRPRLHRQQEGAAGRHLQADRGGASLAVPPRLQPNRSQRRLSQDHRGPANRQEKQHPGARRLLHRCGALAGTSATLRIRSRIRIHRRLRRPPDLPT